MDSLLNCKIRPLMKRSFRSLERTRNVIRARRLARNVRYCNICWWQGKQFNTCYSERMQQDWESVCPNCKSGPPQRALFKYLRSEFLTTYLYVMRERNFLCLEIGPERSSNPVEKALKGIVYISIDLEGSHAMFQMDLTNLIFKDFTFDLVICSHVLEHIEDDLTAISQIYRVLKKGGVALIQIPIGFYEDLSGTRTIEFGERRFYEHVRSYGWDFEERLIKAGFEVKVVRFTNGDSSRLGIEKEVIFEGRKVVE